MCLAVAHADAVAHSLQCIGGIESALLQCIEAVANLLHQGPVLCMLFRSVQYLEHVLGNQGIGVQGLQPWIDVGIEHAVARYVGVLQFHHRFAILLYLLYGGEEVGRIGFAAGERGLVAVDEVLHSLGLVPAQVVGDVVICLAHLLVLDETLETCLPALLVLEAGIVPCIVGNGEEGSSGHRTLLHGVGYEALAIVQR